MYSLTVLCLISFSTGCNRSNKWSEDIWQDIKATELIGRQHIRQNEVMTAGLSIYVFRILPDKLEEIQDVITHASEQGLDYKDMNTFMANGFLGFKGGQETWQQIGQLLEQSKAVTIKQIRAMVTEGINEDTVVLDSLPASSFSYYTVGSETAGIGLDAGQGVLRLKATSLIGLRQACNLQIVPVYKVVTVQKTKKKDAGHQEGYEFVADSASFSARLEPGQFVLLVPAPLGTSQVQTKTIGDILFYPEKPENAAHLFLVACNYVRHPL